MPSDHLKLQQDYDHSTFTPSSLAALYEKTMGELSHCSQIAPGDLMDTPAMEQREIKLLEMETSVLNLASRVPLKNEEDINALIDMWEKASAVNYGEELRPTDKIAMNIFRHLSGHLF